MIGAVEMFKDDTKHEITRVVSPELPEMISIMPLKAMPRATVLSMENELQLKARRRTEYPSPQELQEGKLRELSHARDP